MTLAELLTYIFDGQSSFLSEQFEGWLKTSRHFRTFAENYRDKIRKKVRNVQDDEALKSLLVELMVAWLLLHDQRFVVEYEKYGTGKQRSPDFSILYRSNTWFNLEVTRLRSLEQNDGIDSQAVLARKVVEAIMDKIGQLPSSMPNGLLIISASILQTQSLADAMKTLRLRAESKDEEFFAHRGFQNAAQFLKQFRQLGVVMHHSDAFPSTATTIWLNPLAAQPFQKPLLNALINILIV